MESHQRLMHQWTPLNGYAHLKAASITPTLKQSL